MGTCGFSLFYVIVELNIFGFLHCWSEKTSNFPTTIDAFNMWHTKEICLGKKIFAEETFYTKKDGEIMEIDNKPSRFVYRLDADERLDYKGKKI